MPKDIRVNQQWRTRDGSIVRVVRDHGPSAEDGWRWVLSNGSTAHEDDGRVIFFEGKEGPSDLMALLDEGHKPPSEAMMKAQDDMIHD